MAGQVRPRRTASSPAATPSTPASTARTGQAAVTSAVTAVRPGNAWAAASSRPPASARTPDHARTPPATAISSPTTARPGPRTASSATPAAGTSGAASPPLSTAVTGGSGGSRCAVTCAHACPPATSARAPATTEPRTAAVSSRRALIVPTGSLPRGAPLLARSVTVASAVAPLLARWRSLRCSLPVGSVARCDAHAPVRSPELPEPLRRRDRRQHRPRLVPGLRLLGGGIAVGHDAGAGLHVRPPLVQHRRPDGDRHIHVAAGVDVADRARVERPPGRLQRLDDFHGPGLRRPGHRAGREGGVEDVERVVRRRDLAGHRRHQVHDVAVVLHAHEV